MSEDIKTAIIDYGMGNLFSVQQACMHAGIDAVITRGPQNIEDASALILPGVGAFGDAMNNLRALNLIDPIKRSVEEGKPFLGICLGLQLLMSESEEFGTHQGLNIIPGRTVKFPLENGQESFRKVPQVG
ncbi:MAG: imidazole glycerol phosphate synthase subunit HisH, partial [Elusimicrobia bacterium]|nr:imidazole glycerol phosphate synthase subunit HisH [Elusimicrobiota bacterium]MBD3412714.1 imidazole glycerol phosphate synthase subunit HisH [Elusimicrobiota bacterium]